MKKLIVLIINVLRWMRAKMATTCLHLRLKKYGRFVGAARVPHIARTAAVIVGDYVGFNGITITGWGG